MKFLSAWKPYLKLIIWRGKSKSEIDWWLATDFNVEIIVTVHDNLPVTRFNILDGIKMIVTGCNKGGDIAMLAVTGIVNDEWTKGITFDFEKKFGNSWINFYMIINMFQKLDFVRPFWLRKGLFSLRKGYFHFKKSYFHFEIKRFEFQRRIISTSKRAILTSKLIIEMMSHYLWLIKYQRTMKLELLN